MISIFSSDVTNTVSSYSSSSSNLPSSHSKSVTSPSAANPSGRSKSETQSEPVDFSSNPPLSSLSAAAAARSSGFADTCSTADNLARYRSSAASGKQIILFPMIMNIKCCLYFLSPILNLIISLIGYPSLALNPSSYNMNLSNTYSSTAGYAAAAAYNQSGYGCLNPYTSSTFAAATGGAAYDQDTLGCYGLAAAGLTGADPLSSLKSDAR